MAFTAKNGTGTVFTFKSTVNGSSEHVGHFHCDSTVLAAGAATAANQATGNSSLATLAAAVTANKVQAEITNTPAVTVSGVSTAANQATGNASLSTIAGAVSAGKVQAEITNTPAVTVSGVSTAANQATGNASLATLAGAVSAAKVQCEVTNTVAATVAGVATAANQSTGNASLATIAGAVSASKVQAEITNTPAVTVSGVSTAANQSTGNASLATLAGAVSGSQFQVNLAAVTKPTSPETGQQTVTTSAVALNGGTSLVVDTVVTIIADVANAVDVFIGKTGVTTSTGLRLNPGMSIDIEVANINTIFAICASGSPKISWICPT